MDGTLTRTGKFEATLLHSLQGLQQQNIAVIIVTGRSAGWTNSINHYLPISGAIAENGGVFFPPNQDTPILLTEIADLNVHRQQLEHTFKSLQQQFPQLKPSSDNYCRLTDWTFDVEGLGQTEIETLDLLCQQQGWSFTYSTVQCHIKPHHQDKGAALVQVLTDYFGEIGRSQVVTVGDSPNDQSLFNPVLFPLSVGVANVQDYWHQLQHQPAYLTTEAEAAGFNQLAQLFLPTL
jgi:HAD superfamily hydrolase (TIGR01484 family)